MELSYFRKSTRTYSETLSTLRSAIEKSGLSILAEKELTEGRVSMILACKPEWARTIIEKDHRLAGFLPCSFYVFERDGAILVGTGQPSIIKSLVHGGPLAEIAIEAEGMSKSVIHEAADVSELKPTAVVVYATQTCPYCTYVKQWLESNGIEHSVLLVDKDREAGKRIVEKTGQMGVPVTEVLYGDDAEAVYVLGFDEAKLADLLVTT